MKTAAVLVISCSLHPQSRSRRLAEAAAASLRSQGAPVELIDLRDHELPFCDGDASRSGVSVAALEEQVAKASAVLLAAPVYNYDLNAAAKNLIELTGDAWEGKLVGFLCAAGGRSSYMSPIGLANSLMLDFRCWIIPRFVYATKADFAGDQVFRRNSCPRGPARRHGRSDRPRTGGGQESNCESGVSGRVRSRAQGCARLRGSPHPGNPRSQETVPHPQGWGCNF